ncbi:MAG TPA: hypothetical protein VMS14_01815 [Ilumatobacteraceae bacterium]|nr:hypothetical protein [Ilumatobacteraceae bacterium]
MLVRRVVLLLGALAVVVACDSSDPGATDGGPGTAPIGVLPPVIPTATPEAVDTEPAFSSVPRTTTPIPPDAQVGRLVEGNRVIMIGDSVMASTSERYSDDMCGALVPLGWQVEMDAETGRFAEFGDEVLDARLSAGWDTAVILLGNNYRGNQQQYREQMDELVERLSPRPVVLLTVSEFEPSRVKVNEVIFELAQKYDNVLIVDWGATTAADQSLVGADGLHLTTKGRASLAGEVALALGPAPVGPGECLDTEFDDDSGGSVDGTTSTTVRRPPRTTVPPPDDTEPPPDGTEPPPT